MRKLDQDSLDKLEDVLIKNLTGEAGEEGMSAAHLDLVRKLLEKNNRLYVRPKPKDCGPALEEISDPEWEPGDKPKAILPFPTRKQA